MDFEKGRDADEHRPILLEECPVLAFFARAGSDATEGFFRRRGMKTQIPWWNPTAAHPSRKACEGWGTHRVVSACEVKNLVDAPRS
jgi:hypothetical protein